MRERSELVHLRCPDLSVCLSHVASMLIYDPVEPFVLKEDNNVILVCNGDDGSLDVVVSFVVVRGSGNIFSSSEGLDVKQF
jgi:hypothetical protein